MEKYLSGSDCLVMTREQVRAFDLWAINELGMRGVVLMENAGRSCAELVRDKLSRVAEPKVCVFCGSGNNGGDGYVIARHLLNYGFEVRVVLCGDRGKVKGDAKINLDVLEGMGQSIEMLDPAGDDISVRVRSVAAQTDMVVDALFGTGLQGQLRGDYIKLIECINALGRPVLAVDIPSGLDCDTGEPLGAAIKADCTVSFVAVKKGFGVGNDVRQYIGDIYVASIGIDPGDKDEN
ncbi:MAG: NAD(P)H-hydrate epimerase [Planctomycetota bacterium]|jgi:NAD(P)H-hydrate epimerase